MVTLLEKRENTPVHDEAAGGARVDPSDEAIAAAAAIDRSAFGPLYLRYADPVFRYAFRRLENRAIAEDATSRIFERAIGSLKRFHGGSFRAWLYTIARNIVTDMQRAAPGDRSLDAALLVADGRAGPEEIALDNADGVWIRGLLSHLTEHQRQIVELRLSGLNDIEIAHVLGRSHGSVRTVQYRALQRLRLLVGEELDLMEDDDARHR